MSGVRAAAVLLFMFICTGCGETFRPVATPVAPNPPNPAFSHFALVITGNGTNNPGASTSINVSGDTAVSRSTVGIMPVHAAIVQNGFRVYVANSLDDTVSSFSPASPTPVTTTSLATGSIPSFVASTEAAAVYVANSGNNTVSAISAISNAIMPPLPGIPVGVNPVALPKNKKKKKLYVANHGNGGVGGSVSSINAPDRSVNPPVAGAWVSPVQIAARSDSNRVYVLDEGSGTVSAIDPSTDTLVGSPASVGVGANFMLYEPTRNRLYVSNPVANTVTFLDATSDLLSKLVVPLVNPVSVAALPDGSRVYVSSATVSGANVASAVTVINASDGSIKSTMALGAVTPVCASNAARLSMAASADSSKVYVGNCDAGNVTVIKTLNDTVVLQIPAPQGAVIKNGVPLPQNPVFVVSGP